MLMTDCYSSMSLLCRNDPVNEQQISEVSAFHGVSIYERPPKPPTIRNSYTRTLILDMIMKLSGTIGVTQKTMTFDIHVYCLPDF